MKTLGLVSLSIAMIAGCDGGTRNDAGMIEIDGGDFDAGGGFDAGRFDAGRFDAGGGGGSCGPAAGMCDLIDTSTCMDGQGCQLQGSSDTSWTTMCFPSGTGTDGTACDPTMAGQCAEGFGCDQSEMVCRRWCCQTGDCEPGQFCNQFLGAEDAGICTATAACNLVTQTGCDTGEACNVLSLETGDVICDPAGTAGEGDACMARNACTAGHGCFTIMKGAAAACRRYCDTTAAMPCVDGFMCAPLPAPMNTGICVPR